MYQHKRLNEVLSSFAYTKVTMLAESKSAGKSEGALAVGIENPDTGVPEVKLDMEVESFGNYFFLN